MRDRVYNILNSLSDVGLAKFTGFLRGLITGVFIGAGYMLPVEIPLPLPWQIFSRILAVSMLLGLVVAIEMLTDYIHDSDDLGGNDD
jgi:hypothetical protein